MKHKLCAVSLLWLVCLMWSGLESEAQNIESFIKHRSGLESEAQKIESFIKQLRDENESVRRNAVIALGNIGEPGMART